MVPSRSPFLVLSITIGALTAGPLRAQDYELVPLGTLGGSTSEAFAISAQGRIFGWATTPQSVKHPVYWENGVVTDLGSPPGFVVGEAVDGNDAGQVAVNAEGNPQSYQAFRWEDGVWTDLGMLPEREETIPDGMGPEGRVVGVCLTLGGGNSAAFLAEGDSLVDLGTLGGTTARAYAVNGSRQIAGRSRLPEAEGVEPTRAFRWENDVMTDLGKLPDRDHSQALDINDKGDVVGSSWTVTTPIPLNADRATLWRSNGEIVDLGLTPGPEACAVNFPFWTDNVARAVNNHGQVVGEAQCVASGGARAAFLWENGVMSNLNDRIAPGSGWDLISARDINDDGRIVGFGIEPGGHLQAYLLVPSPAVSAPVAPNSGRLGLAVSPNPFRTSSRIAFVIPRAGPVRLTLHDVRGRRLAELAQGPRSAGRHEIEWPGEGRAIGPGVYFLRLEAAGRFETVKVVRVR